MRIGERLQVALDARGVSQTELARRTGYAQSKVSGWVNGRGRMYADQAYDVCKSLGIPMEWLLNPSESPSVPDKAKVDSEDQPVRRPNKYADAIVTIITMIGFERALARLLGLEKVEPLEAPNRTIAEELVLKAEMLAQKASYQSGLNEEPPITQRGAG